MQICWSEKVAPCLRLMYWSWCSEPTGSISIALKSREQETSNLPCARSAAAPCYCTFYSTSLSQEQRTHPRYLSRQCLMIVPFSQPQHIDQKRFRALIRTIMTLQPPLFILLYMHGSLKYKHSKLFHGSFYVHFFPLKFFPTKISYNENFQIYSSLWICTCKCTQASTAGHPGMQNVHKEMQNDHAYSPW